MNVKQIPRYSVFANDQLWGSYLTLDAAKEVLERLRRKGFAAKIVERIRIW
jgi:hypothetical protein